MKQPATPTTVLSQDGKQRGQATGGQFSCRLEGCTGQRITTRWPDGRITHPCTKGMQTLDEHTWQIG